MPIPSLNEWKHNNKGKGINDYYRKYPEAKHQNLNQPIIVQSRNRNRGARVLKLVLFVAAIVVSFNVISIACLNQNANQIEDASQEANTTLQKN